MHTVSRFKSIMKRILIGIIVLSIVLSFTRPAHASSSVAGHSAVLISAQSSDSQEKQIQIRAVSRVLARHKSPMADEAENFITVADTMDLDPYMLPAIAGVESGFGRAMIDGTYNPFGWNVGRTPFASWSDGITTVGTALRYKYIDRGADTLDAIGYRYAGGSTTWAPKVRMYIAQFEREEARIRRYNVL